jgi:cytochrome b561/polyisoprenoid-binding protein YceI
MPATHYHRLSQALHWLIAGLILFMIPLGWRLEDQDSLQFARYQLHKSVGILILLLTLVRIWARIQYKAPSEVQGPAWQMWAARLVHYSFYGLMLGLPLSGWAMSSTSVRDIVLFGVVPWPHLPVGTDQATHEIYENMHGILAKIITYGLIPLHIGAALKHHFIDKDLTLDRMVPGLTPKPLFNWRWALPLGVVVVAVASGFWVLKGEPPSAKELAPVVQDRVQESSASAASTVSITPEPKATSKLTSWVIDKAYSNLGFQTAFSGETINGNFTRYQADIRFDPVRLEDSQLIVKIDLASVNSGDEERDQSLKSASFFNIDTHPQAIFEAARFRKTGPDAYVALGYLTLHGVKKPYELAFKLTIKDKLAIMSATSELDRLAFGVGSGEWASADQLPAMVKLKFSIRANAKP